MGENCFWQPRNIPPESKLIKLHGNVVIASEVLFVNHDVMHYMFKHMENSKGCCRLNLGAIEFDNNVFIGSVLQYFREQKLKITSSWVWDI